MGRLRANSHWLAQHLVDSGAMTAEGVTRRARGRTCRKCRAPILAGLDGDSCAQSVEVDPTPLTAIGEAMALLGGRGTWQLVRRGGGRDGHELIRRDRDLIRSWPAGLTEGRAYDVLPRHKCRDNSLDQFMMPSRFETKADYAALSDDPPF